MTHPFLIEVAMQPFLNSNGLLAPAPGSTFELSIDRQISIQLASYSSRKKWAVQLPEEWLLDDGVRDTMKYQKTAGGSMRIAVCQFATNVELKVLYFCFHPSYLHIQEAKTVTVESEISPWTDHQSITRSHRERKERQSSTYTFSPSLSGKWAHVACMDITWMNNSTVSVLNDKW